jgi:acyl-coenzyme A thioesterase PaaI-like protein
VAATLLDSCMSCACNDDAGRHGYTTLEIK